jgi:hypothetical protein
LNRPISSTAADIVRIQNGVLVEHWDVIQDEATEKQSKSKAPMFGTRQKGMQALGTIQFPKNSALTSCSSPSLEQP